MRKMRKETTVLNVLEWIQVGGCFWEYYVIEEWNEENVAYCLVDGDFQEVGLVSLDEIAPFIAARTKDLQNLQPAPGWKWVEQKRKTMSSCEQTTKIQEALYEEKMAELHTLLKKGEGK